jgi:uncharacterized damage-inducible protein DinB
MRPFLGSVACCALAVSFTTLHAQSPVADALRTATARAQRNLVEAADEMPSDKYGYKPTPEQMTVGQVVLHLATGNALMCGWISGATPPDEPKLAATDPKEKLVERLKSSFAFCASALAQLDDSKLGDSIPFFGRKFTRAAEILALGIDWEDHYSQMAIYLRLNGLVPPTAKRKEM